jgi:ribosomal-protein-alanine N-acetyltransferase
MQAHGFPLTLAMAETAAALHAASGFNESWSAKEFSDLLSMPGTAGIVAAADETPAGLILWRSAADEAEILTICVLPDWRRMGLGRFLLENAAAHLKNTQIRRLFLEVAIDNEPASALYKTFGFQSAGHRPGYYRTPDGVTDALIFMKEL